MKVPMVGNAETNFEIFMPGAFLVMNVIIAWSLSSFENKTMEIDEWGVGHGLVFSLVVIIFSYFFGFILRLSQTDAVDRLSGIFLVKVYKRLPFQKSAVAVAELGEDTYPYYEYMKKVIEESFIHEEKKFFHQVWLDQRYPKEWINFAKTIINAESERASKHIEAAEAFVRYMSSFFYACVLAFALYFLALIGVFFDWDTFSAVSIVFSMCVILGAMMIMLARFRMVRLREAETIFAACFHNRKLLCKVEDGKRKVTGDAM